MKVYTARMAEVGRNIMIPAKTMGEAVVLAEKWATEQNKSHIMVYSINYLGSAFLSNSKFPHMFLNGNTAYRCTYSLPSEHSFAGGFRSSLTRIFFSTENVNEAFEVMNTAIQAEHLLKYNALGHEKFMKELKISSFISLGKTFLFL